MSIYRKVESRMWNDQKFIQLPVHGKLAWVALLTHPAMTALGGMRGTPNGIAEELACGEEGLKEPFRRGIDTIIKLGMAHYDPKASLIVLPNFLRYNKPESPNVVRAWGKAAAMLPECKLKDDTIHRAKAFSETFGKGFEDAFGKAFPKTTAKSSRNQRTESREQRAENREPRAGTSRGWDNGGTASTHTHEDIPVFMAEVEFCGWLSNERTDLFPGDPAFSELVKKWKCGDLTKADIARDRPSDWD